MENSSLYGLIDTLRTKKTINMIENLIIRVLKLIKVVIQWCRWYREGKVMCYFITSDEIFY